MLLRHIFLNHKLREKKIPKNMKFMYSFPYTYECFWTNNKKIWPSKSEETPFKLRH